MSALRDHDNRAGSRSSSILRTFDAYAALRALRDSALRGTCKLVAFALIARANASGECWPGYDTIGRDAGVDRRTAIRAVGALERAGILEKVARRTERGDADTNRYKLRIGLPARPREEHVEAPVDADVAQLVAEVEERERAGAPVAQLVAEVEERAGAPVAEGVVIVDPQGGDRGSPDLLRETPREERGHAPVNVRSEGEPWQLLLAEYDRARLKKYGVRGLKEPVSTERRAAVVACLNEAIEAGVTLEPLVRGWFDLPGRDGYLREKRHPFRCLLADLDGLIAAAVSKVRQKARERERGELAAGAPRQAPSSRPARSFAGAAAVLQALGRRT